jgi:hypothetical protein
LTLLQNCGRYKEHAVTSNICSFPRTYLLSLSLSQYAVANDNFNNNDVSKLKAKSWFRQLDPGLLKQRLRFDPLQFHVAFTMMMDNWTAG